MNTTIIFCTDNSCSEPLFSAVVKRLKRETGDIPIISVSHKPLNLGTNICVGKQRRSWLCLYRQLLLGLQEAKTENIHIAEHDCFYTNEHFNWTPSTTNTFYYNENVWLVQSADKKHQELKGMYSQYWRQRLALSQLICNRELYLKVIEKRLDIIDQNRKLIKEIEHIGEPGLSRIRKWADSGRPVYLKDMLGEALELEQYATFKTELPNLDVRHDGNFTGPKRGRKRCYKIPYWGRFEDLLK